MAKEVKIEISAENKAQGAFASLKHSFRSFGQTAKSQLRGIGKIAPQAFGTVSESAEAASGVIDTAFASNPLGAIIAGATALAAFFGKAVDAANEYQKATLSLKAALGTIGPQAVAQLPRMQKFAESLQDQTTMSREEVMAVEQSGAAIGKFSGQTLQEATKAAIGFGAAYGITAQNAMKLFAEAAQGGAVSLSRYGVILPKGASAQDKLNALIRMGSKDFALAKAQTDTLGGAWKQFMHTLDDTMAKVGKPVLTALIYAFKGLGVAITIVTDIFQVWYNVGKAIFTGYVAYVKMVIAAFRSLFNAMPGWLKGWVSGFGNAIKTVIGWFKELFGWLWKIGKATGLLKGVTIPGAESGSEIDKSLPVGFKAPTTPGANPKLLAAQKRQAAELARQAAQAAKEKAAAQKREQEQALRQAAAHHKEMLRQQQQAQRKAEQLARQKLEAQKRAQHEALATQKRAQAEAAREQRKPHLAKAVYGNFLTGLTARAAEENPAMLQVGQQKRTNQILAGIAKTFDSVHEVVNRGPVLVGANLAGAT